MKISRFLTAFITLLMLAACDGAGFLIIDEEPVAPVTVETVHVGKLVRPEETLPIDIIYNSESVAPDTMLVELVDADGETLSETVMDHFQTGLPFPDIALPENLEFGAYTIRFTIYESETLLSMTETPFFYTADEYSILGIEAYPLVFFPGGDGLLFASFEYPLDDDATYVRWTRDDSVLAEGILTDGMDMIQITAPDQEGIHSITLEMFPEPPPEGQEYLFRSSIEAEINIFVARDQKPVEKDLLPDGNYHSILHMRGEMTDTGFIGSGADPAVVEGDSVLDIRDDLFGYTLDRQSSIILPYAALPVVDGSFSPFTLTFRMQLDEAPDGADLYVCGTDDDSFNFSLTTDRTSGFKTAIRMGGRLIESAPQQPIDPNAVELLSLSVIPGDSSVEFRWYSDGALMGMDSLPLPETYLDTTDGFTEIGGGIAGLIDEVGVYFRNDRGKPSPDPEVFHRSMFEAFSEELLLAEGFDGLTVPADLLISAPTGTAYELTSSSLRLKPGMSLTLPPFSVDGGNVGVIFGIVSGKRSTLFTISDADSEVVLCSFSPGGTLTTADSAYPIPEDAPDTAFYLFSSDEGYGIGIGNSRYIFSEVPETLTDFTVTLENSGTGVVAVGDLLIRDISDRENLESRAGLSISDPVRKSVSTSTNSPAVSSTDSDDTGNSSGVADSGDSVESGDSPNSDGSTGIVGAPEGGNLDDSSSEASGSSTPGSKEPEASDDEPDGSGDPAGDGTDHTSGMESEESAPEDNNEDEVSDISSESADGFVGDADGDIGVEAASDSSDDTQPMPAENPESDDESATIDPSTGMDDGGSDTVIDGEDPVGPLVPNESGVDAE